MAVLLAARSAVTFGIGDFYGGLSARRIAAQLTTAVAQATGLVLIVVVALVVGGSPGPGDLGLGVAAGLSGGVALVLFGGVTTAGPAVAVRHREGGATVPDRPRPRRQGSRCA